MSRKIALITGANRGLGRSMALHLAKAGVGIVGTYRTHKEEADLLEKEISEAGGRTVVLPLDVSRSADFAGFKENVTESLASTFEQSRIDFLINNAGIGVQAPFATTSESQFDELVSVHLKAPFFLSQTLLPLIVDNGRILHVSSGTARHVVPGYAAYGPIKAAVEVLTMYMAKELGQRGLRVNVIAPGAVATISQAVCCGTIQTFRSSLLAPWPWAAWASQTTSVRLWSPCSPTTSDGRMGLASTCPGAGPLILRTFAV